MLPVAAPGTRLRFPTARFRPGCRNVDSAPIRSCVSKSKAGERKEAADTADLVDQLMGKKPELRLAFIQTHAASLEDDMIDV